MTIPSKRKANIFLSLIISVQTSFLNLFVEKILTNERIRSLPVLAGYPAIYPVSCLAGYPAVKSGIRLDTAYQKRPDYPTGQISGASLSKIIKN
jgi:hypothetical protein